MDYHELQKTTVDKLREMAHEMEVKDALGYSKEDLVDLIAEKKGIEKPHKVVVGIDKPKVKKEIRELKKERLVALENKDKAALHDVRRKLHKLRHQLRKATKVK